MHQVPQRRPLVIHRYTQIHTDTHTEMLFLSQSLLVDSESLSSAFRGTYPFGLLGFGGSGGPSSLLL